MRVQLSKKAISLSWFGSELWMGDIEGHVSLMDTSHGQYTLVQVCVLLRCTDNR